MARLLVVYALITAVPVIGLGIVLAGTFRKEADRRGLAEGRSEATLIAQVTIGPELDGRPLSAGVSAAEKADLDRVVRRAVAQGNVLRARVRDLAGRVVYSEDGSGFRGPVEDEVLDAAHGETVLSLTHLNADSDDEGPVGVASVEVYLPLVAGTPGHRVGVLELYLPYAPIARDVRAGLHSLYLDLALGLAVLYALLFAITVSVSRGLRRELSINAFLAHHDALTDLPNRALFLTRAREAVAHISSEGRPTAVAIIDLDHFKDINDTLGHQSGDELLTKLAHRVSANMRLGDTVARLGGDEFGLILRDVADAHQALARLREVIAAEVDVRGLSLSVAPSIGFVAVSDRDADVDTMLQHAEVAMYAAKTQHAGVLEYRPDLNHYDASSLGLVAELRHAISDGQLVLHYQPQASTATGRITALEALVRWEHPEHGLLAPDRFLPLAEQTDLIDTLTHWVLDAALSRIQYLTDRGLDVAVAVNVSARSIVRQDFAREVIEALERHDVPPERLIVEVTETALLIDPARAAEVLARLADAGVTVSLDDFGQGQTSLGYLSRLPVQELKIDRSFVTDMHENPAHAAIVRSIVDLGHNLAMRVVAEGIETEAVLDTLRDCGCDVAQGFFLARPMPADSLEAWLAATGKQSRR
ncbi:MAG TPA: bifunctional diguanylate cyclase/phosphodiesterase [Solirubrobacteraceae bacterium]|jgi:diguanylate cyclase (GGDEF)-like protein